MKIFGTAVILAGGKSTRMGFDKQFLEIQGERVLDNIGIKLEQMFDDIIVVTNRPEFYLKNKYRIISDEIKDKGPLSGLHIALKHAKSKYVYITACDMPFVNLEYIDYMKDKLHDKDVMACLVKDGDSYEPFNAFYNVNLLKIVEENIIENKLSLRHLFKDSDCIFIKNLMGNNMYANMNVKDDIKKVAENFLQSDMTKMNNAK